MLRSSEPSTNDQPKVLYIVAIVLLSLTFGIELINEYNFLGLAQSTDLVPMGRAREDGTTGNTNSSEK